MKEKAAPRLIWDCISSSACSLQILWAYLTKKKYGKFDFILILRGEVCISSGLMPLIDKKKQKSKKLVHKSLNLQIIPNKIRNSLL